MLRHTLETRLVVVVSLVLSSFMWALLFFIGYFFASSLVFYLIILALIIAIYFLTYRTSKKLTITLSAITIMVAVFVFFIGFEEDYCWGKGDEADSSVSKMVIATKEDADGLKGYDVKEGTHIGASFRAHMLCHNTFDLAEALKERLIFIK